MLNDEYGYSGFFVLMILIPNIVKIKIELIKILDLLKNWILFFLRNGIIENIMMDKIKIINPLSLLLIDRRIEKKNKKYHSGSICGGVLK